MLSNALGSRLRRGEAEVFMCDLRVHVPEAGLYAYPDLKVCCDAPEVTDHDPPSLLNPTVVVEVLSESTAAYDAGPKAAHYRLRPSLKTIVLVDSRRSYIQVQARNADGTWTLTEGTSGALVIASLGVVIPVVEIYDGVEFPAPVLPKPRRARQKR